MSFYWHVYQKQPEYVFLVSQGVYVINPRRQNTTHESLDRPEGQSYCVQVAYIPRQS